jgi:type II secretory pathway component PulF
MKPLSQQELIQAVQTLGLLVRREYSLTDAVQALGQDKEPWVEVGHRVEEGDELGTALRRYPQVFSPFFSGMIQAAEESDNGAKILSTLSVWLEASEAARRRIQEMLYYPVLLLSFLLIEVALILGIGVQEAVLPLIYVDRGPVPAGLVTALNAGAVVCFILAAIVLLGSWRVEALLPLAFKHRAFRSVVLRADQAIWARALAAFLQAGVPLPEALEKCSTLPWSKELQSELAELEPRLRKGDAFSKALSETELLDPQIRWAVTAGETREDLSATLLYAAERLEHGLMERCQAFILLLQPLAIILIGLVTTALLAPFWWSFYHYSWNISV